ncbi:hypothetical protein ACFSTA_20595 [Ornithinibacillus salinisoli]|uniref:Uncharacterized protein n=1 Tax=Ornithinibacillus salinisoli TaxID=1848459 RepID=A0ABW4W6G4_9BACI
MYQYKLYNSEEIDKLKRDLNLYKQNIKTLKSGDLLVKYLEMQRELYDYRLKFSTLKGEMHAMEDRYEEKLTGYETQAQKLTSQIQTINDSLNQLKLDVNLIKGEVKEIRFTELLEKMNIVINKTDESLTKVKGEIVSQEEKFTQLKEQLKQENPRKTAAPRQSEYRRLQNMLQSFNTGQATNTKNNRITSGKTTMKRNYNPNPRTIKSIGDIEHATPVNKTKKSFRSSQFEVNKNIITKTTTPQKTKTNGVKDVNNSPSFTMDNNNSVPSRDDPIKKNLNNNPPTNHSETNLNNNPPTNHSETNINNNPPTDHSETNINNKPINHPLPNDTSPRNPITDKVDEELVLTEDTNEKKDEQPSKKRELASIFSIFKKD